MALPWKPSILRNLTLSSIGLGPLAGIAIPIFAEFFVDGKSERFLAFFAICVIWGGAFGLVNFWMVKRILLRPMGDIAAVANAVSEKDISHRCELISQDLIGDIGNSFNSMTDNLGAMMGTLNDVAGKLSAAASRMGEITEETGRGARQQQDEVNQVAAAVNQMSATAQEVARKVESEMTYPGQIKVTVIREIRTSEYAR